MIYWVGGYARSGTSMMMGCLIAGGMPALYGNDKGTIEQYSSEDYRMNDKLYELNDLSISDYRGQWDGHLVKYLGPKLIEKTRDGDKVILMMRDYRETMASHEKTFGHRPGLNEERYERRNASMCHIMRGQGVQVLPIWYKAVVESPLYWFEIIKAMGWPISPQEAAEVVNPAMYRHKETA